MSITSAMFTGVSGLLANAEGINVIGNNLSNVNTVGFKSSRMLFSDMLSANIGNGSQIGRGTQIQKVDNIFSQNGFETTESVTDLAIQGSSFFALGKPGETAAVTAANSYLTRAGAFSANGDYNLVNPDGYVLLESNGGEPIKFLHVDGATAGDFVKVTSIDSQGVITYVDVNGSAYYYNGNGGAALAATSANYATALANGAIAVVNPSNPGGLTKVGGTLFQVTSEVGPVAFTTANGTTEKLSSNSLEQSNVDMAAQFVKMILTQRAYSANSKTITTADEMTQEVLNLKR